MDPSPVYSICMCNYNMARTLERALESILVQIDGDFEVVLVDDGSSDDSVEIANRLAQRYPALRVIPLQRDGQRQLGFTRNISIEKARGTYVLLHLDCDDISAPHIKDFVKIYRQIEQARGGEFLLSGRPIQMGPRDFLLNHGPYRNIHRGEDRDMWGRLAAHSAIVFLENRSLKTVLPKTRREKIYRSVYYTFDHLRNDFRGGARMNQFLYYEFFKQKNFNLLTRLIRFSVILPAFLRAKMQGPLPQAMTIESYAAFAAYRAAHSGTFDTLVRKYGGTADWQNLSDAAKDYF